MTADRWDAALEPAASIGVTLDADEVERFVIEAAEAIIAAGDADDFTGVAHLVSADLLVHLQRRDQIADRMGDSIRGVTAIDVSPYGGRIDGSDLILRLQVTYRMQPGADGVQVRREAWTVALPLARLRRDTGGGACPSCGAPRRTLAACRFCGTPATSGGDQDPPRILDINPA